MQAYIAKLNPELVPVDREELALISYDFRKQRKYYRMKTMFIGTISSIFHEPLYHYGAKHYFGGERAFYYLKGKGVEISYIRTKRETKAYVNKQQVAFIDENYCLWTNKKGKKLAELNADADLYLPVFFNDKKIGNINRFNHDNPTNSRVFSLINTQSEDEQKAFLLLSLFYLLKESLAV